MTSLSSQGTDSARKRHYLVSSFTGCKNILDKMHTYFRSESSLQRVFVLHGLGGTGKTQLALKFCEESKKSARFSKIIYIDASSEQSIISSLNHENTTLDWLAGRSSGDWLLLFDNADDVGLNLQQFFPRCQHGNILITTRNRALRVYAVGDNADVQIKGMDPDDAINLLFRLSEKEHNQENEAVARVIVQHELYCFALAVAQAGSYIYSRSISLERYRYLLTSQHDFLMQNNDIPGQNSAVYVTWGQSYSQLDESARAFLQICSILNRDEIPEDMFKRAALSGLDLRDPELQNRVGRLLRLLGKRDVGWDVGAFRSVVASLSSYSLIDHDESNNSYSIHPLVQRWVRTTLEGKDQVKPGQVLSIIALSVQFDTNDYGFQRNLLPHLDSTRILLTPQDINVTVATFIASIYSDHGYWHEAEALEVAAIKRCGQELPKDHPDTLRITSKLAITYRNLGMWREAEALGVEVTEKYRQILGDDGQDTLISIGDLASTYRNQGKWRAAEAPEVVVMEKLKRKLGDNHPYTLISMGNLASTYRNQGRWKEAEALEVVAMQKLGDDHPYTLIIMANLASTYSMQGRWEEAEALGAVAMEKSKQRLGEDHPDTLSSMSNLANIYRNGGLWMEAEALETVAMKKRKQRLGDDHPYTLASMGSLAHIYWKQGRLQEAESLEAVVLRTSKRRLGDDHPDTLQSMGRLADIYRSLGHLQEAEAIESVVSEKYKQILGDEHPDTLISMGNLASMYRNQGKWREAEVLGVAVMAKLKQKLGEDHPITLKSMKNLALTYHIQGEWEDAEALQVVVLQKCERKLRVNHPDTLEIKRDLALTHQSQGRTSIMNEPPPTAPSPDLEFPLKSWDIDDRISTPHQPSGHSLSISMAEVEIDIGMGWVVQQIQDAIGSITVPMSPQAASQLDSARFHADITLEAMIDDRSSEERKSDLANVNANTARLYFLSKWAEPIVPSPPSHPETQLIARGDEIALRFAKTLNDLANALAQEESQETQANTTTCIAQLADLQQLYVSYLTDNNRSLDKTMIEEALSRVDYALEIAKRDHSNLMDIEHTVSPPPGWTSEEPTSQPVEKDSL